jgi:hypothetical protein
MAQTESNDAAFPLNVPDIFFQEGLTKREYFAAMALQGLLASNDISKDWDTKNVTYPFLAVCFADALIQVLNKTKQP